VERVNRYNYNILFFMQDNWWLREPDDRPLFLVAICA